MAASSSVASDALAIKRPLMMTGIMRMLRLPRDYRWLGSQSWQMGRFSQYKIQAHLWAYLKTNPLANNPSVDLHGLAHRTRHSACSVQGRPDLQRAFLRHTGLALRLR